MLNITHNKIFNELTQEQIVLGKLVYAPILCVIEETSSSWVVDIPEFDTESFVTIIYNNEPVGYGIFDNHRKVRPIVTYSTITHSTHTTRDIRTHKQGAI